MGLVDPLKKEENSVAAVALRHDLYPNWTGSCSTTPNKRRYSTLPSHLGGVALRLAKTADELVSMLVTSPKDAR